MIYLIIIFTVLFSIFAFVRLDWAVMFLIAALPAYLIRFNILGLPATLLEVMIWVVFLIWLVKNFSRVKNNFLENFKKENKKIKIRYPFDWEIVLLLLVAFVAVGVSSFSFSSLGILKAYFFEPVMFFIVVLNIMKGDVGRNKILWSLAISALTVSLLAIYQKITGNFIDNPVWAAAETRRVVSFFGYPNAVGLYLGPIILIMVGWFFSALANARNDKIKIFFIGLAIIMSILSIYFAKSKGALLGVAAGLIVFGLMVNKKVRWSVVIALLLIMIGVTAYQPARKLVYDTATFKTFSGQIRMVGWEESWKMLKDGRLITGAGLANFKNAVAPYHAEGFFIKNDDPNWLKNLRNSADYRKQMWQPLEIYLYPHNIILNFWSELGLAGMMLFVWIILKYFWVGIKNYRQASEKYKYINIGLICAMVAIVVHGLVDVPYFKNDLSVMFWLFVAMISMINLEKNYGENNI
ncbi:MAG: O-antigen ligase family protein [Patescibacteria group bacterium]